MIQVELLVSLFEHDARVGVRVESIRLLSRLVARSGVGASSWVSRVVAQIEPSKNPPAPLLCEVSHFLHGQRRTMTNLCCLS